MSRSALVSVVPVLGAALPGCTAAAAADVRVLDAKLALHCAHVDQALREYDVARIEALWRQRLQDLAAAEEVERSALHELGRLAHGLADAWKLRETFAVDDTERDAATARRLQVVEASLPYLRSGLATNPHDPQLAFSAGELMAFRIDGVLTGLQWGRESEVLLRRSPLPEARLALAKRYYYLPPASAAMSIAAWRRFARSWPSNPRLEPGWGFLGQALLAAGDADAAAGALEHALELNPRSLRGNALMPCADAGRHP